MKMIKRGLIIFVLVFGVLLIAQIGFASASIYFSNIQPAYNLGDIINIQVSVNPIQEEYLVKTDLLCNGLSVLSFNSMPDDSGKINIKVPLSYNTISSTGSCSFKSVYAGETQNSRTFEISKGLTLSLDVDSFYVKPGDTITISGQAYRIDGSGANGIAEISIPLSSVSSVNNTNNTNITTSTGELFSGTINEGKFSMTRTFARDIPSGDYRIKITAYEVSSKGVRTNEASVEGNLKVAQILNKVDISISEQTADPGVNISFTPNLFDQTGIAISDDVSVKVRQNETVFFEKIIKSGESASYSIPTDMASDYYKITASNSNLSTEKAFFVKEKAIATFVVANETLTVTNIGNIPYERDIEVDFSDENGQSHSFVKHVSLELGESKDFKLTGINQKYNIKIGDGQTQTMAEGVVLTGNAISVKDIASGGALVMSQPIVWIFLLIILVAIILFLYRDYFRKKSVAKPFDFKTKSIGTEKGIVSLKSEVSSGSKTLIQEKPKLGFSGTVSKNNPNLSNQSFSVSKNPFAGSGDKSNVRRDFRVPLQETRSAGNIINSVTVSRDGMRENIELNKPEKKAESAIQKFYPTSANIPTVAEQGMVSNGQRSVAAILLLKIKSPVNKISKEAIERAINCVFEKKGAVLQSNDFVYAIFTPLLTRAEKNEATAARCAERIANELRDYNSKFKDRISFGIGINTGEIINKIENNKLKFTVIGTSLPIAKRLADAANETILLSKPAYERAMAEIKAGKINVNGTDAYEIRQIVDYDKNKKFIEDFMKRQGRV